jgi:hypothetical protein
MLLVFAVAWRRHAIPKIQFALIQRIPRRDRGVFLLGMRPHVEISANLTHIAYCGCSCRDTLFIGGCGRFFEGTPEEMILALTYIGSLPDDTVVYNGHEYTSGNAAFALSVRASIHDIERPLCG